MSHEEGNVALPGMVECGIIVVVVLLIYVPLHKDQVAGWIEKRYRAVFRG